MAFDAGMLACVAAEIRNGVLGAKIEKINQPARDEIVLLMRSFDGGRKLFINVGSNPRISFTETVRENPPAPPMFCMLLRKHLSGAKLTDVRQEGFERVLTLEFETRDEMGFTCTKYLIVEIMGKYSNLIFADAKKRILGALRTVDFSTSGKRQVLPGMTYELPPAQEKVDPLTVSAERFSELYDACPAERRCDQFITSTFLGISAAVGREISLLASGHSDQPMAWCRMERVRDAFETVMGRIREEQFDPCMVLQDGKPVEYAFLPLTQYGEGFELRSFQSAGALLDAYFSERDRAQNLREKASDILRLLSAADARIRKKLELQRGELADCERGGEYKRMGDLITANLYALRPGMRSAELTDYGDWHEDGTCGTVTVELDERLTPAQNAQRYFKKYAKTKTAREALGREIQKDEEELSYLSAVFDALTRAETSSDLQEIREELSRSGYASKMKRDRGIAPQKKSAVPAVARYRTRGGLTVYCGKNNLQNEYVTHKLAQKTDYWFHAKGVPGSHVVLVTNGTEPDAADFTDAAQIAAQNSAASGGQNIPVDYTLAKNVKKTAGGKPGLVIYHTNWTAYVTPDAEQVASMRVK